MSKQVCFPREPTLFREPIQGLPQKQSCPLTVVDFFRLPFCFSCDLRLRFCRSLIVQVREDHPAAAFQCAPTIVHIGSEMFECAEEKRTEASLLAVSPHICASLDQVSEKTLDQI